MSASTCTSSGVDSDEFPEAEPLQSPEADSSGPALGPMGDRRLIRLYLVRKVVNIVLRRRLSIPDAPPMALAEVGRPLATKWVAD